jgi:tRNA threonylcarbamoyladenosine modification (KEOPS) complex Cgi121 subunit
LAITGFRNVKIGNVKEFIEKIRKEAGNVTLQFFNAKLVAGWEHLYFAVLNALTAFKNKLNISNSLAVEILLYASAQRQIRNAVELFGIKEETNEIAVVVLAENKEKVEEAIEKLSKLTQGMQDDEVSELNDEKFGIIKEVFGISDLELEAELEREGFEKQALRDLVIEHIALLVTKR